MTKILLATHGTFAQGAYAAATIIIGKQENVSIINAYTQEKALKDEIKEYFQNIEDAETVIVLTDIFGGSVNQAMMPYTTRENVYVITGFNLALLLEVLMIKETTISEITIRELIEQSKAQIQFVNDALKQTVQDDFD